MNGLGQAVGNADTTVTTSGGTMLAEHAFFYSGRGPLTDLGTLGGPDSYAIATAINNSEMVVGYSDSSGPGNPTRAFVWTQSGGMQALPMYPGGTSSATDINNLGQIVGYATDASGAYHSFLYSQSAGVTELNPAYPPMLINDADEVVAIHGSTNPDYTATYISRGGTSAWVNIGSLGGNDTQPYGINTQGSIAGFSTNAGDTLQEPFIYSGGTMVSLGSFGGNEGVANGINDSGFVVGESDLTGDMVGHAFIYYGTGSIEDLNGLVDPTLGWNLASAIAINDAGEILVAATRQDGPQHAVLLTPVTEPSALLLLFATALLSWLGLARRLDRGRFLFLGAFHYLLRLSGGSDHVQASMDGCFGGGLGDRRNAARKEKVPVP